MNFEGYCRFVGRSVNKRVNYIEVIFHIQVLHDE